MSKHPQKHISVPKIERETAEITWRPTSMGGMAGFFRDHYGEDCVIQKSQQRDGDYLWLGLELEDTGKGSQMLLTREQVRDLIPHLFQFALRGTLDPPAKLIPEAKALKMELK